MKILQLKPVWTVKPLKLSKEAHVSSLMCKRQSCAALCGIQGQNLPLLVGVVGFIHKRESYSNCERAGMLDYTLHDRRAGWQTSV